MLYRMGSLLPNLETQIRNAERVKKTRGCVNGPHGHLKGEENKGSEPSGQSSLPMDSVLRSIPYYNHNKVMTLLNYFGFSFLIVGIAPFVCSRLLLLKSVCVCVRAHQ